MNAMHDINGPFTRPGWEYCDVDDIVPRRIESVISEEKASSKCNLDYMTLSQIKLSKTLLC